MYKAIFFFNIFNENMVNNTMYDNRKLLKTFTPEITNFNTDTLGSKSSEEDITEESQLYRLSELFHENTKLRRSLQLENYVRISDFYKPHMSGITSHIFTEYPTAEKIQLPKDFHIEKLIGEVIIKRRSQRQYSGKSISLGELSKLLYGGLGVTGKEEFIDPETGEKELMLLRAAPSGGALYPIDGYILAINVEALSPGIYHYNAKNHELEVIYKAKDESEKKEFLKKALSCFPVEEVIELDKASAIIILTATFWRTLLKYGDRGYRLVLQESGHIAQNILLVATALDLAAVPISGFYDDEVNSLLGLDGVEQAVIYAIVVGKPKPKLRV